MSKHEGTVTKNLQSCLETCFGYTSFREGQRELAEGILSGRDVIGVLPPGEGKSVCWQLPAIMLEGQTVVIARSLPRMKGHVDALIRMGISAAALNPAISGRQYSETLHGAWQGYYKVLYISSDQLTRSEIRDFASGNKPSLLIVDEAHHISDWSEDFMPAYRKIPDFISLLPERPVIGAFSSAATPKVQKDIRSILGLRDPLTLVKGFAGENLRYDVIHSEDKNGEVLAFLEKHAGEAGIIRCATAGIADELTAFLRLNGIKAGKWHGSLPPAEKSATRNAFLNGELPVIVAADAFYSGKGKTDIRFILHYNMPTDIETYIREISPAGKDKKPACCRLLYSPSDVEIIRSRQQDIRWEDQIDTRTRSALIRGAEHRLHEIICYCLAKDCLANRLRSYFGEEEAEPCGTCGNCSGKAHLTDVTPDARKILGCVFEVHEKYGRETIIRILHGQDNDTIRKRHLDKLPSFGVLSDIRVSRIRAILDELIAENVLQVSDGRMPVIELGPSWELLRKDTFRITIGAAAPARRSQPAAGALTGADRQPGNEHPAANRDSCEESLSEVQMELFERLRHVRFSIAKEEKVPPYIVFSDKTLRDMARKTPTTEAAFREIYGVGEVKLRRYGESFLAQCRENVTAKEPADPY